MTMLPRLVVVTAVPFGSVDPQPLQLSADGGVELVANPIGRKLKPEDRLIPLPSIRACRHPGLSSSGPVIIKACNHQGLKSSRPVVITDLSSIQPEQGAKRRDRGKKGVREVVVFRRIAVLFANGAP